MAKRIAVIVFGSLACFSLVADPAEKPSSVRLEGSFDLAGKRTPTPQMFMMESRLIRYALNGTRLGTDLYRLRLKCDPARAGAGDRYTCVRFSIQPSGEKETTIPALENWSYVFKGAARDQKGQVLGIDHSKFERMIDENGRSLPPDRTYHAYNAFIDFHSFCSVFADRTTQGRGIQDLKRFGDKIVHAAAFSEPPVNLGSSILPGSFFKNGQITLEFQGISRINDRTCAVIAYDSGESAFKMLMRPMPQLELQTVGSSHYFGVIWKDLATQWVQKATMTEWVVSETTLPVTPNKINAVIERVIEIRNIPEKELGDSATREEGVRQ